MAENGADQMLAELPADHPIIQQLGALAADLAVLDGNEIYDRNIFARRHGISFGGERDLYEVLGYKRQLGFGDYFSRYERQDIATSIIDRPINATWGGGMFLQDDPDPEITTPFETAFHELDMRVGLVAAMRNADTLASIGHYSVLLLGIAGQADFALPIRRTRPEALLYVASYNEQNANVASFVDATQDPRYGLPLSYDLQANIATGTAQHQRTIRAHWSRCIHVAFGGLDNRVMGVPAMRKIWNLLDDLMKVVGGAAETFWQQASYVLHANTQAGARALTEKDKKLIETQIQQIRDRVRKFIGTSGMDLQTLGSSPADPTGASNVIIALIAAATGIPIRYLTGSERGQLASTQDDRNFADKISHRRSDDIEPVIVRPMVDRLIEFGILPEPLDGEYTTEWGSASEADERERADTAGAFANAARSFSQAKDIIDIGEARVKLGLPAKHPNPPPTPKIDPVTGLPMLPGQEPRDQDPDADPEDEAAEDEDQEPEDEPE